MIESPDNEADPTIKLDVERLVYETPWIDLYYDDITHPNGNAGNYARVQSHSGNGAVMTIPVTPSGKFLLIKVYHHPLKRYLWEFPAGVMEDGESPEEAGRRDWHRTHQSGTTRITNSDCWICWIRVSFARRGNTRDNS